jgi:hypothetical protein
VVSAQAADGDSLLPVVIFCFSKKKCEEIADLWSGQDLLTAREKGEVKGLMGQVARRLNPTDARLPQVEEGVYLPPHIPTSLALYHFCLSHFNSCVSVVVSCLRKNPPSSFVC